MPHAHGRDLRKGRVSQTGRLYLVTVVTHARQPLFADLRSARCLVRVLRAVEQAGRAETLCFVVMPDHLHWLLGLGPAETLPGLLRSVKSYSAREINALRGTRGRVWQAGFHDHALRAEEDAVEVARYVVANPVRAGLARRVGDYPFWDARWL